ncbi:hypothetical protein [Rhizobium sp. Root482]|uniref:hypothetical protein n=1 Tax=Rhizobium sp. Root482 TaxID=1736543 RepID=UPI000AFEA3C3|nr:hypothetical protein [Rhizobium sp. Root482]
MGTTIKILLAALILPLLASAAGAAGSGSGLEIAGPVSAEIVRVIDGDTVLVMARPWPQQIVEVYVRLRGIDAPELKSFLRGDARCRPPGADRAGKSAPLAGRDPAVAYFRR